MRQIVTVTEADAGQRLDKLLAEQLPELTRSAIQNLMREGCVTLAGAPLRKNAKAAVGDTIWIELPEPKETELVPEEIPLDIIYEDDDIVVVNKPRGMVVHPAPGNWSGTLVNALMYHCGDSLSGINGEIRPGIVHRIDKDTSGLLVVAKNDRAHQSLAEQIKEHSAGRRYYAVVYGAPREDKGTVNAPIARHRVDRKKMAVTEGGRQAITHYEVLERYRGYTYMAFQLETGRTHQIRVHMAHIGHPIIGDPLYGPSKDKWKLDGQCLHAGQLTLTHPATGERMTFEAPLPAYFTTVLQKLRNQYGEI
ncbi:RluA family pseudouridine synthase [Butyricicoccus porcorum]|uniref:Pseudouridine synthase n=1 Tax=Butyricicoccus porcorum TaxID=1945634 RepID=A0A252F727_9FIRM|nr:RluA family pseudouridine synthase [Butyricicoccus porcorum]MCI6926290.1 RluA family pseudouridine synthase [Butyricicoccus porcorum]MDD6986718.1 RluA family pseudouridine synthase [Butyricicoccus porcorum]MDY4483543.1 RluA family pseudouridine synthase [Butyricicoccus porcorum]OUM21588.1 RNA pseudouridine synthase [Butyricicoccus porcorum]